MQLVPRTYVVSKVEESDPAKWEGWAQAEEERGDFEAAQGHRDSLRQWVVEQGEDAPTLLSHQSEPAVAADCPDPVRALA